MGEHGHVEAMGRVQDIIIPLALKKDARATTRVKYKCNLNEDHGPNWGEDPNVQSVWRVTDVDGNVGDLVIQFTKTGPDTWDWTITDLRGGTFNETTGVLEIDNDGNIVTSQTSGGATSVQFTASGGTTPVTIELPPVGVNVFEEPKDFVYSISSSGEGEPAVFRASYIRDYHDVAGRIYDSLGTEHTMTIRYERIADVGGLATWRWQVINVTDVDPNSGLTSSNGLPGFQGEGTIQFDADGRLASSVITTPILIDPNNRGNRIQITPDFSEDTQYAMKDVEGYTNQQVDQDGYAMGVMTGINIDEYGYIKIIYSNGEVDPYARIALKVFTNPTGLSKVGDTAFAETFNSGEGMIMAPWTNSAGKILAGTLEMSNVNLAEEFTNMIITQRGFQANTRVITTSDEMLTDLIGLKR